MSVKFNISWGDKKEFAVSATLPENLVKPVFEALALSPVAMVNTEDINLVRPDVRQIDIQGMLNDENAQFVLSYLVGILDSGNDFTWTRISDRKVVRFTVD